MPNQVQAQIWHIKPHGQYGGYRGIGLYKRSTVAGQNITIKPLPSVGRLQPQEVNVYTNDTPLAARPWHQKRIKRYPRSEPSGGVLPASISVASTTAGVVPVNAVQTVTLAGATGGTFTLTFGGQTTSGIASTAIGSTVQTAFRALSSVGSGNATVTGGAGGPYTITFTGTLAGAPQSTVTASAASLTGTNEVQTLTVDATGGTFTLTFGGQTTSAITYSGALAAATIQTAFLLLSSVGSGHATVTGSNGGPYTITFISTLGSAPQALVTANSASLTGNSHTATIVEATLGVTATVTPASQTTGVSAVNAVQTITAVGTSGSFRLAVQAGYSLAIPVTASAADVQVAIAAANGVGPGNVTVTGNPGGPWAVTFVSALASQPVAKMVAARA